MRQLPFGEDCAIILAMAEESTDEMTRRLALAEVQIERSKVVMESLAGFCHALGQPAQVLLSSIELLKMPETAPDLRKQVLDMCYDAAVEIRSLLAQMKERASAVPRKDRMKEKELSL